MWTARIVHVVIIETKLSKNTFKQLIFYLAWISGD